MNVANLPTSDEDNIAKLKQQLAAFCEDNQISKFEADDIVELLEDGESVAWLIEQLKGDAPNLDTAATSKLLADIRLIVCPEDEPREVTSEETPEKTVGPEPLNISDIDFSQIDISQLSDMLPEGTQLPAGMDMKRLQQMLDSPQGRFMADLTVFCQEQGVDLAAMNDPRQVQELEERWKQTPRPAFDGETPAEMLAAEPSLAPPEVKTYRREEPHVGRNDPCPCGSGKKYKKCCGRGK
jgi:hypothetical protein